MVLLEREKEEKPFLADGSLVEDYRPLIMYWRIASGKSRELVENTMLSQRDFRELERIASSYTGKPIASLQEYFIQWFRDRVDPDIAVEAIYRVYGVRVSREEATNKIASIIALWLLEAGRMLKIISYRSWRE